MLSPRLEQGNSTSFGWGKGWNVTSAGWQVTLCDSIRHASSSSGVPTSVSELLYPCYFTLLYLRQSRVTDFAPRTQRTVRLRSQTPLCTARITTEGCQSAGGNAQRGQSCVAPASD